MVNKLDDWLFSETQAGVANGVCLERYSICGVWFASAFVDPLLAQCKKSACHYESVWEDVTAKGNTVFYPESQPRGMLNAIHEPTIHWSCFIRNRSLQGV